MIRDSRTMTLAMVREIGPFAAGNQKDETDEMSGEAAARKLVFSALDGNRTINPQFPARNHCFYDVGH
ncbi:hypothetical protein thsrh120_54300 [Rhizobium sp. No.120]